MPVGANFLRIGPWGNPTNSQFAGNDAYGLPGFSLDYLSAAANSYPDPMPEPPNAGEFFDPEDRNQPVKADDRGIVQKGVDKVADVLKEGGRKFLVFESSVVVGAVAIIMILIGLATMLQTFTGVRPEDVVKVASKVA